MRFPGLTAGLAVAALALLPAAAPAADAPASQQGGPTHSGNVQASIAPPLGKRWARADIGRPGPPILYDGRVFVVGRDTSSSSEAPTLFALDAATGATLWAVSGVGGEVSAAAGLVFAASGDAIVARDAASGAVRWTVEGSGSSNGGPVADDDLVYVVDSGFRALRTSDGLEMWSTSTSGSAVGRAAADADRAYALSCGGVLAVQRTLGVPIWQAGDGCSGSDEPPVVAEGRVWAANHVLRATDGTNLGPWSGQLPSVAGDRTLSVASGGVLRAADFEGRRLWQTTVRDGSISPSTASNLSRPLIVGQTVYVVADGDTVLGFDLRTGAERWRSETRLSERSYGSYGSDLAARGDRLLVPYADKLVAYGPGADAPGVDPDPWRDPSAVSLALGKPSDATIVFGGATAIPLDYRRRVGQDETLAMTLEVDTFPFGTWKALRPVTLREQEAKSVRVKPDRNTRYRVRHTGVVPAKVSEERTIFTDVALRVRYRYLSRTRLRARVVLRAPADRLASRRRLRVPFYFYKKRGNRSRRLAIERLRRVKPTTATGTVVLRVPRRWGRKDYVFPCLPERRDDGFGEFNPGQRLCGRRRF